MAANDKFRIAAKRAAEEAQKAKDTAGDVAGDAASTAGDVAGDAASTAGDVAGDAASTAGDVAGGVTDPSVAERIGEVATSSKVHAADVASKADAVVGDAAGEVGDVATGAPDNVVDLASRAGTRASEAATITAGSAAATASEAASAAGVGSATGPLTGPGPVSYGAADAAGSRAAAGAFQPLPGSGSVNTGAPTIEAKEWVRQPARFSRVLPVGLAVAGLGVLGALHTTKTRDSVERHLQQESLAKLQSEFPDLKVKFNGRDATLEGSVADPAARQRAHDLVRGITGVRHVNDPKVAVVAGTAVTDTTDPAQTGSTSTGPASSEATTSDTLEMALPVGSDDSSAASSVPATTVPASSVPVSSGSGDSGGSSVPASSVPASSGSGDSGGSTVPASTVPVSSVPVSSVPVSSVPVSSVPVSSVPASSGSGDSGGSTSTTTPLTEEIPIAPIPAASTGAPGDFTDRLLFDLTSADLSASSSQAADDLAAYLKANPDVQIGLSGHTDRTGSTITNLAVSKARADAVRSALVERGIDSSRIKAYGYGSRLPIDTNSTSEGRRRNRRVDVQFFGGAGQDVSFTG